MEANSLSYVLKQPQLLRCHSNCGLFSKLHNRMASIKIAVTSQYYCIFLVQKSKKEVLKMQFNMVE